MTEREKMLAGLPYLAADAELTQMRRRVRRLVRRYNETPEEDEERRNSLLAEILGGVGAGAFMEPPCFFDYGVHVTVGARFFANTGLCVLDCAPVHIGDRVMLGPNVQLYTATHPLDAVERAAGPESARPITIGDDVWVGGGAVFLPGVTIGDRSVIGAGSVVTRNIPADVVAAGNPCRVLRALRNETTTG